VITACTAVVILGGIKSIANVCEKLVPFMAVFYIVGCTILLVMHAAAIPETLRLIVSTAFTGQAAVGGFVGAGAREAIRYGVARGLSPTSRAWGARHRGGRGADEDVGPPGARLLDRDLLGHRRRVRHDRPRAGQLRRVDDGLSGAALTKGGVQRSPGRRPAVLTVGLLTFVFSTILGWSYYGEKAAEYLYGVRVIMPYRVLWVAAVMVGSVVSLPPSGPSPTSPTGSWRSRTSSRSSRSPG